jgi:hypothetical protein
LALGRIVGERHHRIREHAHDDLPVVEKFDRDSAKWAVLLKPKRASVEAALVARMVSIYPSINQSAENTWVARLTKITQLDFRIAACRGRRLPLLNSPSAKKTGVLG